MTNTPPGLTCDQYYVYLESGYTYSFTHNLMYLSSQIASEQCLSTLAKPHVFDRNEIAYLLVNGQYFDFENQRWMSANFTNNPERIRERVWRDCQDPRNIQGRLQQRRDDLMNMMAGMSLKKNVLHVQTSRRMYVDIRPKPATCRTSSEKVLKMDDKGGKDGLRRVQAPAVRSQHKSRRAHPVTEKVKTLPSSMALNREFWKTVL
jgi:hypothetical protein